MNVFTIVFAIVFNCKIWLSCKTKFLPGGHVPNAVIFTAMVQYERESENLQQSWKRLGPRRPRRIAAAEEHILEIVEENFRISTKSLNVAYHTQGSIVPIT